MTNSKADSTQARSAVKSVTLKKAVTSTTDSVKGVLAFPVIGLGASAGGLEALEQFFEAMSVSSGAAFIIISHLDPHHVSLMSELLQNHTSMPVAQIVDATKIKADHVYIIPPNRDLAIVNGILQLLEMHHPRGAKLPINHFFNSLAQDQGANAIGIILSGTGSDGSLGIKAIKAEFGMTMAQSEDSAKYDGMPRSAIATGMVDYVLPPEEMSVQLLAYLSHSKYQAPSAITPMAEMASKALQKIFAILRARTGHDFSQYKKNTIYRRIERRMHVHQIDDMTGYLHYLQESDIEADILFNELLIGVTSFFRDADAFASLKISLISLLESKPEDYTIRIWVTGCSSGEEAYSVAMLMIECMELLKRHFSVQVFGTDIDDKAITIARSGLYSASILSDVSEMRLQRFFIKEEGGNYRIKKNVREMLIFATQNLIKDPPFTKLDLLCCRNLLIYLGPELQKSLFPLFHYSLKPDGVLFLGSSESIGQHTDYFKPLDKKWKIFRSIPSRGVNRPLIDFPASKLGKLTAEFASSDSQQLEEASALQMLEAILQQSDAAPCVIINQACNITYIYGKTGKFLEPAQGKVSVNLLEMLRPGLKKELVEAIHKVSVHKQEVICKGLSVEYNASQLKVDLLVKPILASSAMRGMIMIVFDEVSGKKREQQSKRRVAAKGLTRSIEELEQALIHTREDLQTTIEELETSNEELKSINEELQSTNEELQSTNEELETSKEELQSLNEESTTVNAELQGRIDELSEVNDDMKNLLDSTDIATVFLDSDLCIRRFTPRLTDIIPLGVHDSGRPISHFATALVDVDLAHDAQQVLDDLITREKEIVSQNSKVYLLRLRPYRTVNNVIDGVVITFQDIPGRKRAENVTLQQAHFVEGIVNTVREPLIILNSSLQVVSANASFYATFIVSPNETKGRYIYELGNGQWNIPELIALLEDILPSHSSFESFRVDHTFETIGQCRMLINARRINMVEGDLILLAIENQLTKPYE